MKTTTIQTKCRIWDTEYTIRDYGTHIILTYPYDRWVNNTGSLAFGKVRVDRDDLLKALRSMSENGCISYEDDERWVDISCIINGRA